jgi:antitoxin (DNA-binding transcriptional repressor) of toxin-antitoxin stability system
MEQVGIRELRNQVAAVVRRAAAGERIAIAVDGVPRAQLGPLVPDTSGVTLADQAAAGLVEPPRRPDRGAGAPTAADPPVDVRLDRVMDELRGR